jgi:positive regulator of sigma E activity
VTKALELAMLVLFGALFGLLLGVALNPDLRRYTMMALCLFITAACVYWIVRASKTNDDDDNFRH